MNKKSTLIEKDVKILAKALMKVFGYSKEDIIKIIRSL